MRIAVLAVFLAALFGMQPGAAFACDMPSGASTRVTRVEAMTLTLDDGQLLLPGTIIAAPIPAENIDPLASVQGAMVRFVPEDDTLDRHGRLVAQIFVARDGLDVWLQDDLVRSGAALVMPRRDSEACAVELLEAEEAARLAQLGVWASPFILPADAVEGAVGRHAIVEGTITDTFVRSEGAFLDFGEDWRTDFSVFIARGDMKRFGALLDDVRALQGRRVRVRGFVGERAGPQMRLSSPHALALLP